MVSSKRILVSNIIALRKKYGYGYTMNEAFWLFSYMADMTDIADMTVTFMCGDRFRFLVPDQCSHASQSVCVPQREAANG